MPSTTTSVRLPAELSQRLEQISRRTGRGKNAIITEAVSEYLRALDKATLAGDIRRASISLAANDDPVIDDWLDALVAESWKG
jgi:predicted DNA-binding protein